MSARKVLVVGAGIGGLGASIALARAGLDVDTVEIQPQVRPAGIGINQPGNSLRALDDLGLLEQCLEAGYSFDHITHRDWHGREVVEVRSALGTDRVPANSALSRADLHRILVGGAEREGVAVRYGVTVESVDQDDDGVDVTFTDGTSGRYDAVVAFDGIRSPMRARLFGTSHDPEPTGYVVWRVTAPRPADLTHLQVWHGVGSNAGAIPVSAESMYLFHVRAEEPDGRPAREDLPRILRGHLAGYTAGPVVHVRESITADSDVVYSPLEEVHLPTPWSVGRIILLGDAAHAATPLLTQGAAMALEDALVVADALASPEPVADALTRTWEHRQPRAGLVQEASRRNLEAGFADSDEALAAFTAQLETLFPRTNDLVEGVLARSFRLA